jgi:hypothetical protein
MKKTFLSLFAALAIFAMTTTSCKKDSAVTCSVKALEYLEAYTEFMEEGTVANCNAFKKAANDYLKSCKKFMDADEIEEIEKEIADLAECVS